MSFWIGMSMFKRGKMKSFRVEKMLKNIHFKYADGDVYIVLEFDSNDVIVITANDLHVAFYDKEGNLIASEPDE